MTSLYVSQLTTVLVNDNNTSTYLSLYNPSVCLWCCRYGKTNVRVHPVHLMNAD